MYDGTNFMGIKGYDQCQFFESDVILGASGEHETDSFCWKDLLTPFPLATRHVCVPLGGIHRRKSLRNLTTIFSQATAGATRSSGLARRRVT